MHVNLLSRTLLSVTLLAFVAATVPGPARAGMISTASSVATAATPDRNTNLAKIEAQLARADVQAQLQKFGVKPADAQQRIAALSDEEVASLAQRIDQAPAGGDVGLFAVLGIVFVVLLVMDYVGAIHIFSHRR